MARVTEIMADPDAYPLPPRVGPERSDLLALLGHETESDPDQEIAS